MKTSYLFRTCLGFILLLLLLTGSLSAQTNFILSGKVYSGTTGLEPPNVTPISGVTVKLWGTNNSGYKDVEISSTTTNSSGWYSVSVDIGDYQYEYFIIEETDPGGYYSHGATSVGGTVLTSNRIQYNTVSDLQAGKTLTGNKFWDKLPASDITVRGNSVTISDGDSSPSTSDHTDFGSADVSGGTVDRTYTIQNTGSATLSISGVSLSGSHSGDFSVTSSPSASISAGATSNFTVRFNPNATGTRSATVNIANNSSTSNYDFAIQGTGTSSPTPAPEINVQGNATSISDGDTSPSSSDNTDFGNANVTSETVVKEFTIQNTGTASLTISGVTLSGSHSGDFSVSQSPPASVSASSSGTFRVTFDPSASGTRSASISIGNNDSNENPYNFSIQGTGTTSPTLEPEIDIRGNGISITDGDVTPSTADWTDMGSLENTTGSITKTFYIHNTGTATLTITGIGLAQDVHYQSGSVAASWGIIPGVMTIAAGSSTTLGVVFFPIQTGTYVTTLIIESNDSDEDPYTFDVQGTGTEETGAGDRDYGDAPDPTYPTVAASNGAYHELNPDVFLGLALDADPDGQPTSDATGDDVDTEGDDEDGVVFSGNLFPGTNHAVNVTASIEGLLFGWIDFNRDGDWEDQDEIVFSNQLLQPGLNVLAISVPLNAMTGQTFARFRFSTSSITTFAGGMPDGEVEDYQVTISDTTESGYDFGDAPSPYPTLLADNGAYHTIDNNYKFGATVDAETDGQPDAQCLGDDNDGNDDEEGNMTINGGSLSLNQASITIGGYENLILGFWFDWDRNGSWANNGGIFTVYNDSPIAVTVDVGMITFNLPITQGVLNARIRIFGDSAYATGPTGFGGPGEVEDYQFTYTEEETEYDYGDAPSPYPVQLVTGTVPDDGGRHPIVQGVYLGSNIDEESDGQPDANALGDDKNNSDDEDGIQFTSQLAVGQSATINVTASTTGYLNGYFDWNQDGDWDDSGERILNEVPVVAGVNNINFIIPAGSQMGHTYARFRFSTSQLVLNIQNPNRHLAKDGEVEDYKVTIVDDAGGDPGGIKGRVWDDLNKNGIRETGEPAINNVWVDIQDKNGSPWMGTATNLSGIYEIPNLPSGTDQYYITFNAPTGYVFTSIHQGADPTIDNDAHPSGQTDLITVVSGIWTEFIDAGLYQSGGTEDRDYGDAPLPYPDASHLLGGPEYTSFNSSSVASPDSDPGMQYGSLANGDDKDGVDDEEGLAISYYWSPKFLYIYFGVKSPVFDDITMGMWIDWNGDGDWDDADEDIWALKNMPGGCISFKYSAPSNTATGFGFPVDLTTISGLVPGQTYARMRILTGDNVALPYSGDLGPGEVEDYLITIPDPNDPGDPPPEGGMIWGWKWNDVNGNGIWNTDESALSGWTIFIDTNNNGVKDTGDPSTLTDSNGYYLFAGLAAGTYTVQEEMQSGWTQTFPSGTGSHSVTVDPTATVFYAYNFGNKEDGTSGLGAVKWYQPPLLHEVQVEEQDSLCYQGWRETSISQMPMIADDWFCYNPQPVMDIRWWGGYADWDTTFAPPNAPDQFHLGVWTDVPKGVDGDWSHPGELIHEWITDRINLNERVVRGIQFPEMQDTLITGFEYTLNIPQPDWFYQDGDSTVYWLSITAMYEEEPDSCHWGWLTREHNFHDDAVRMHFNEFPHSGSMHEHSEPIDYRWDMAFILATEEYDHVFDFGDAPPTGYKTLQVNNGAHHLIVPDVYMGETVDDEEDGQPDFDAMGDDNNGDDEDGVEMTETLMAGEENEVTVHVSTFGFLNGWLDLWQDGNWYEEEDQVLREIELPPGEHTLNFFIPPEAADGETVFRFRFSREANLWFNGCAMDGEVEDYLVTIQSNTAVNQPDANSPDAFSLNANYPNPFNPETTIQFELSERSHVTLKIFDMLGHELETLVNSSYDAGVYEIVWNAHSYPTGLYICKIQMGSFNGMRKMLLMK